MDAGVEPNAAIKPRQDEGKLIQIHPAHTVYLRIHPAHIVYSRIHPCAYCIPTDMRMWVGNQQSQGQPNAFACGVIIDANQLGSIPSRVCGPISHLGLIRATDLKSTQSLLFKVCMIDLLSPRVGNCSEYGRQSDPIIRLLRKPAVPTLDDDNPMFCTYCYQSQYWMLPGS